MSENLLRHEASPYLLQHKDNPVHWHPWGPPALATAAAAGKPILLSVGYAACHWCHVMAHESFEDPATAAVMNELFVNIKVDREERPDIDQIYMAALHAIGEQGGWPLTMFLTPDGRPIWGGTYFPKTARFGRPAFVDVLRAVARTYHDQPDTIATNTSSLMAYLAAPQTGPGILLDRTLLDQAADRLLSFMDPVHGGTTGAPKFPQASLLDFLWRSAWRTADARYRAIVLVTLRNICQGGIYDHIAGGFARYATDARWLVPHFEKMLYDNAQLIALITAAWQATGEPLFRSRIEETVAWLTREMRLPGGAFAASIDADSEGHEGRFTVWTRTEVMSVLGDGEGTFFADTYDISEAGNWEGVSIPNRLRTPELLSDADERRLAAARDILLSHRAGRTRPATDDKILADWNGLTIAALASAGTAFDRPDWIDLAAQAFRFVTTTMMHGRRLAHSWRDGKSVFPGLATDYAAMAKAALALYDATFQSAWLDEAEELAATLRRHHWDPERPGYFLSADDAPPLIIRPRSETDDATPSAASLMAANLIRLWRLTGKDAYRADADAILETASPSIGANLFATTGLLGALDLRLGATDVVIVQSDSLPANVLLAAARRAATPNTIVSLHSDAARLPASHPAAGKTVVDGRPTAYVCRGEACSLPVTDPAKLAVALATHTIP
jgi:uncharacterized protein YyaL (SSP411 family)